MIERRDHPEPPTTPVNRRAGARSQRRCRADAEERGAAQPAQEKLERKLLTAERRRWRLLAEEPSAQLAASRTPGRTNHQSKKSVTPWPSK